VFGRRGVGEIARVAKDEAVGVVKPRRAKEPNVPSCEHLAQLPPKPAPTSPHGCEECLRNGTTWVHLRMCLTCGHVGCCDSSRMKHATLHYRAIAHPVVTSFEPGENWRWCYVDEVFAE
jgi:CPA1 family monovalent cation:H+ antiporter